MSYEAAKTVAAFNEREREAGDARLIRRVARTEPCLRCQGTGNSPIWPGKAVCARCMGSGHRLFDQAEIGVSNLRLLPALKPPVLHAHDGNCEDPALD